MESAHRIPVIAIQEAACVFYGTTLAELKGRSRKQVHSWPRHSAIAVARRLTTLSSPTLGRLFGDRHHTAVLQSCRAVAKREAGDPDYRAELAEIAALAQRLVDHRAALPTGAGISRDACERTCDHSAYDELVLRHAWEQQVAASIADKSSN